MIVFASLKKFRNLRKCLVFEIVRKLRTILQCEIVNKLLTIFNILDDSFLSFCKCGVKYEKKPTNHHLSA